MILFYSYGAEGPLLMRDEHLTIEFSLAAYFPRSVALVGTRTLILDLQV